VWRIFALLSLPLAFGLVCLHVVRCRITCIHSPASPPLLRIH
jgi:hypothetical protein